MKTPPYKRKHESNFLGEGRKRERERGMIEPYEEEAPHRSINRLMASDEGRMNAGAEGRLINSGFH